MIHAFSKFFLLTVMAGLFTRCACLGQANTFIYVTWYDSEEWQAAIEKDFTTGNTIPQLRFLHSKTTSRGIEETHYDDHINYISDAGERWQATIHYNTATQTFYFRHCEDGSHECHDDVIMNYRRLSGERRQLTIENCSLQGLKSKTKKIIVHSRPLDPPDNTKRGQPVSDDGTGNTNNGLVYIDWKKGERCGCSSAGGGYKHYLHNTTRYNYKVTLQTTVNANPNHVSTHDYDIKPGTEVYIGCSQVESQGCVNVDFTILDTFRE